MRPDDLYHTGIVVEDFDASLAWFADTAGYRWTEPFAGDVDVVLPDGPATVSMKLAYSLTEPRLEIVQAVPGTLWQPTDSGLHHLGYWSDDVDADAATLEAAGLSFEVRAPLPDGTTMWAYLKGPTGARIELVNRMIEPMLQEWFAAGAAPG